MCVLEAGAVCWCTLMTTASFSLLPSPLLGKCSTPLSQQEQGRGTGQQAEPDKKQNKKKRYFQVIQGREAAVTEISCLLSVFYDCDKSCMQLKADSHKRKSEGLDRVQVLQLAQ